MNAREFVESLESLNFENTFNPYSNRCLVHDLEDAPSRRRAALLNMIQVAIETEVDAIWIGRDLGYLGGRRTGLAFTDEVHMHVHAERWGITISKSTTGKVIAEKTATIIWGVLSRVESNIFLWNVFPLHPHESLEPFSNRPHNAKERQAGEDILAALLDLLKPNRLIAIGNDAGETARKLVDSANTVQVRHPSYGGKAQFLQGMYSLYPLSDQAVQLQLM